MLDFPGTRSIFSFSQMIQVVQFTLNAQHQTLISMQKSPFSLGIGFCTGNYVYIYIEVNTLPNEGSTCLCISASAKHL